METGSQVVMDTTKKRKGSSSSAAAAMGRMRGPQRGLDRVDEACEREADRASRALPDNDGGNMSERRRRMASLAAEAEARDREEAETGGRAKDEDGDKKEEKRLFVVRLTAAGWAGEPGHAKGIREVKKHVLSTYGAESCGRHCDAFQNPCLDVRFDSLWRAKAFLRMAPDDDVMPGFLTKVFVKAELLGGPPESLVPEDPPVDFWIPPGVRGANRQHQDGDLDDLVCLDRHDRCAETNYFRSYSKTIIHQVMIADSVRTEAYRDAILSNPHLFEGKVVLDVGCGTGILSSFAIKAGAAHVYAVDAAEIGDAARRMSTESESASWLRDRMTVIRGRVEEVELPVDRVDVIVSEWMGYGLLYESMLKSVLVARDRWLAAGGILFPDEAQVLVAGVCDPELRHTRLGWFSPCWESDLSRVKPLVTSVATVQSVRRRHLLTECGRVGPCFKLERLPVSEADRMIDVPAEFRLWVRPQAHRRWRDPAVDALCLSFFVRFTHGTLPVTLSTSPFSKPTHWKQTMLLLQDPVPVDLDSQVVGFLQMRPLGAPLRRALDLRVLVGTDAPTAAADGTAGNSPREPKVQRFIHR